MTTLLAFIFVLSGAAGLIYESIWSRYLGLLVGHSAYAQVIVLVIFLGGMSAGAALTARVSSRVREPLLWYAAIEGIVGLVGLVFHEVFTATSAFAYDTLFPALAGGPSGGRGGLGASAGGDRRAVRGRARIRDGQPARHAPGRGAHASRHRRSHLSAIRADS